MTGKSLSNKNTLSSVLPPATDSARVKPVDLIIVVEVDTVKAMVLHSGIFPGPVAGSTKPSISPGSVKSVVRVN